MYRTRFARMLLHPTAVINRIAFPFTCLPATLRSSSVSGVHAYATSHKHFDSNSKNLDNFNGTCYKRVEQSRTLTVSRKLGKEVLNDSNLNKGTAFPACERERLHIRGLLPPYVTNIQRQAEGLWKKLKDEMEPVKKWFLLTNLQGRNETLYYKLLLDHVTELAPIIYTPTVAYACTNYSSIFRKPRGMFFSLDDKGQMASMVYNWPHKDVEVVVVTDGSRVLGLGDLGMHGMAVAIGKVDLYVVGGGFYPTRILPCILDMGTNNPRLLGHPDEYLGLQRERVEGEQYLELVDEFMHAVSLRWPNAVIQFEDFQTKHAKELLQRYRSKYRMFNDDIQGTAAVGVAAVYGGLAARGKTPEAIVDERIIMCGAGSAGIGVAQAIQLAMQKHGLTPEQARRRFWVFDHKGLITSARDANQLDPETYAFARPEAHLAGRTLLEVVREVEPTALLGLTAAGRVWGEEVLTAMGEHCEQPMIFPMSNPTDLAECSAESVAKCIGNRAIFASGSPFEDVTDESGKVIMRCNQSNNFYIFPGVGLGAQVAQISSISDDQFLAAAEALSGLTNPEDLKQHIIFPRIKNIREIGVHVAKAVIKQAMREGQAGTADIEELMPLIESNSESDAEKLDRALEALLKNPGQYYEPNYASVVYRQPGVDE